MKLRHSFLAHMTLATFPLIAHGQEAASFRGLLEAGYEMSPERRSTFLNPDATLLDPGIDTGLASLNLRGQYAISSFRFVASVWGIYRNNDNGVRQKGHGVTQEAFAEYQPSPDVSLSAGKLILRWGSGYVWNPSNPVNDPDANNTSRARTYQREGDYALKYEWTERAGTASVYVTRAIQNDPLLSAPRSRENYVLARYQHMFDGADITGVIGGNSEEKFAGFSTSLVLGNQLELHAEGGLRNVRRTPQIDIVNIPLGSTTSEPVAVWNFKSVKETTPTFLAGGQYTFENKANVILEYFYNGNGFTPREYNQLLAAAKLSASVATDSPVRPIATGFLLESNRLVGRIRQHYLFGRWAREDILPGLEASIYVRYGLSDQSTVNGLLLRYSLSQRSKVQFGAELYRGGTNSEARLIPVKARYEAVVSVDF